MAGMTQETWNALLAQVTNIVPGTTFNGAARFERSMNGQSEDDWSDQLSFIVSYPCRGLYDFSDHLPSICSVCEKEGKGTHGRIVLASEDGWALLPHIIRSREDVFQAILDLEHHYAERSQEWPTRKEGRSWYDECREHMLSDVFISTLPAAGSEGSVSHNLSKGFAWTLC